MRHEPILATRTIPGHKTRNGHINLTMRVIGGLHMIQSNGKPYFTLTVDTHRKGHPNQCQGGGCDHETILKYYPRFADLAALHLSDINGVPMHAESNGWYDLAGCLPRNAGERYHVGGSQRHFPKPDGAPRKHEWDTTDYREPTETECLQIFADHVRIPLETAQTVKAQVVKVWMETRDGLEPKPTGRFPHCKKSASCTLIQPCICDCPYCKRAQSEVLPLEWSKASWSGARDWFKGWIEAQKPRWENEAQACIKAHGLRVYGDDWAPSAPSEVSIEA